MEGSEIYLFTCWMCKNLFEYAGDPDAIPTLYINKETDLPADQARNADGRIVTIEMSDVERAEAIARSHSEPLCKPCVDQVNAFLADQGQPPKFSTTCYDNTFRRY